MTVPRPRVYNLLMWNPMFRFYLFASLFFSACGIRSSEAEFSELLSREIRQHFHFIRQSSDPIPALLGGKRAEALRAAGILSLQAGATSKTSVFVLTDAGRSFVRKPLRSMESSVPGLLLLAYCDFEFLDVLGVTREQGARPQVTVEFRYRVTNLAPWTRHQAVQREFGEIYRDYKLPQRKGRAVFQRSGNGWELAAPLNLY